MTMQVYASELKKFHYVDKNQTILEAGADVVGVEVLEITSETDPSKLVGAQAQEPKPIAEGSQWTFRDERPVVPSSRGGLFAFLEPRL
jgi:hypothetical protein